MSSGGRARGRLLGRVGIAGKLVILTLVVSAACAVILVISTRGFSRLMLSIDEVQRVQGDFLQRGYEFQGKVAAIQSFVLNRAVAARGGTRNVGSDSAAELDSLTLAAKTAEGGIANIASLGQDAGRLDLVHTGFLAYLEALGGMRKALDAGGAVSVQFLESSAGAFDELNVGLTAFLASLRDIGDSASEAAHALSRSTSKLLAAAIIGTILFCALISFLIRLSITRPLGGLVKAVARIGGGDFRTSTGMSTGDELGRIAGSVDALVAELRGLIAGVKDRLGNLESTGQGLASMMAQTGAAVVQINSSIASTGGQLREQTAAVAEVSAAIEELARSVDALGAMISTQSSVLS